MLIIHEVHQVVGRHEAEFEELYRSHPDDDDVRLLYYLHHAHGTGPAYTVVTMTGVRDGNAWHRTSHRMRYGDMREWANAADALRHEHHAKVLTPLPFSPPDSALTNVDFATPPRNLGSGDEQALFMEDTAWPYRGKHEAYLDRAGTQYVDTLRDAEESGRSMLRLEAALAPVWGTSRRREVVLWQRVLRPDLLAGLLSHDVPAEFRAPGTWMHDALEVRDQWESRLLRAAPWSPLA